MSASNQASSRQKGGRIAALDWMRGLVMVLMALDHASLFFNAGRVSQDSVAMYQGQPLPLDQFFTRWVTHLCAPTFVFLAGTSLALSAHKRWLRGKSAWSTDRDMLIRGVIIIALEGVFTMGILAQRVIVQVLYAIGVGMILMVPLRRLSSGMLLGLGLGWFFFGELLTGAFWQPPEGPNVVVALTMAVSLGRAVIMYPALPWLAMMVLGWVFGNYLLRFGNEEIPSRVPRLLAMLGAASLVAFGLVRGLNGYGNMFLLRADNSVAQWLHVSKYPPSLAFAALELGLMCLLLALMFAVERRRSQLGSNGPLLVFGQTALFFYLFHFAALRWSRPLFGQTKFGLSAAFLAATCVLFIAYPVCRWYRTQKRRRPQSVLRFI